MQSQQSRVLCSYCLHFYLLAVNTLQGKQLLVAGHAEIVAFLLDKVPRADRLLATVASETVLMPAVALVLHLFSACLVDVSCMFVRNSCNCI